MTDHEKIKQKLAAFVDNELKEPERKMIEKHLAQCSSCREEVSLIQNLHHLAKEVTPKPSADFAANLSQQVWRKIRAKEAESVQRKVRFFSIPRFAPILAGAVVVLLVVIVGIKLFGPFSGTKQSRLLSGMRSILPMAGLRTEPAQSETERAELSKKETQPLAEKVGTKEMKNAEYAVGAARKAGTTGAATKEAKASSPPAISQPTTKGTGTGETREFDAFAAQAPKESAQKEKAVIAGENKEGAGFAAAPPKESEIRAEESIANKPTQTGLLMAQFPKESTKIETLITATAVDLEKRAESIDKLKVKGYFVVGIEPEPIEIAKPKYPESARRKKLAGEVVIKAIVGLEGQVEYAEIIKSSGYGILDTAALKAAKKSKFKPVIERGKKVRTWTTIPFRFAVPEK
jgi:TonB family protein